MIAENQSFPKKKFSRSKRITQFLSRDVKEKSMALGSKVLTKSRVDERESAQGFLRLRAQPQALFWPRSETGSCGGELWLELIVILAPGHAGQPQSVPTPWHECRSDSCCSYGCWPLHERSHQQPLRCSRRHEPRGGTSEHRVEFLFHRTSILMPPLTMEQSGTKNQRINVTLQAAALLKTAAPLGLRP